MNEAEALTTLLSNSPLAVALLAIGFLVKKAIKPYGEQITNVIALFGELVETLKSSVESSEEAGEAHAENREALEVNTQALIENTQARKAEKEN